MQIANLAMEEILAQSFSHSTNATVGAVVDGLGWRVIPQVAFVTVISSQPHMAILTVLCGGLGGSTVHTNHVASVLPIESVRNGIIGVTSIPNELVVLLFVMTVSTSCPMIAGTALQLGTTAIVLASQNAMGFIKVSLLLVLVRELAVSGGFGWRATPTALKIGVGHKGLDT
jgi:hypothetical protein